MVTKPRLASDRAYCIYLHAPIISLQIAEMNIRFTHLYLKILKKINIQVHKRKEITIKSSSRWSQRPTTEKTKQPAILSCNFQYIQAYL